MLEITASPTPTLHITYSFVAGEPGTFVYHSGTDPDKQSRYVQAWRQDVGPLPDAELRRRIEGAQAIVDGATGGNPMLAQFVNKSGIEETIRVVFARLPDAGVAKGDKVSTVMTNRLELVVTVGPTGPFVWIRRVGNTIVFFGLLLWVWIPFLLLR